MQIGLSGVQDTRCLTSFWIKCFDARKSQLNLSYASHLLLVAAKKHKPSSNLLKQSGCTTWEL